MSSRGVVLVLGAAAGAALGAALFTSPAAYADTPVDNATVPPVDIYFPPPDAVPVVGGGTNLQDVEVPLLFQYLSGDYQYNVEDSSGNVVGTFVDQDSNFYSPWPQLGIGIPTIVNTEDVIADSTGMAPADGTTYDGFGIASNFLGFVFPLFNNFYYQSPAGTIDDVAVFGQTIPIINTFSDQASAAAALAGLSDTGASDLATMPGADVADPSWLTDLSALF
jgi:hypothetical protein